MKRIIRKWHKFVGSWMLLFTSLSLSNCVTSFSDPEAGGQNTNRLDASTDAAFQPDGLVDAHRDAISDAAFQPDGPLIDAQTDVSVNSQEDASSDAALPFDASSVDASIGYCSGFCRNCLGQLEDVCELTEGCNWVGVSCIGTCKSCDHYEEESSCNNQPGCTWTTQ